MNFSVAGMLSVFAEFERDTLRDRIKADIAHEHAQGKKHGRPNSAALKVDQVKALFAQDIVSSDCKRIKNRQDLSTPPAKIVLEGDNNLFKINCWSPKADFTRIVARPPRVPLAGLWESKGSLCHNLKTSLGLTSW